MNTAEKVFIVGCGDVGMRVARLLLAKGSHVSGLARSPENADRLQQLEISPILGNLDEPESLINLPVADAIVFYFAPPPGGGFRDTRLRNWCAAISPDAKPARVIYLSTSGVYGDCGEKTVTEETPPNPQTSRAKRRFDAETFLAEWGKKERVPVIILRVTGIYGPGRLPVMHLMNGTPLLNAHEAPSTNRIHADDLARVCIAAAEKGVDGDIINVSDGEHGTMTQYFNAVADLLGIPRPRQVAREEASRLMPPLLYSYFSESRQMDNRRMLERLGVTLLYPTLADGLPSCRPDDWQIPPAREGNHS